MITAQNMLDFMPRYYVEMPVATNIIGREADELARLNAAIDDVLAQFFIETATWGLTRWEWAFGITHAEPKTYAQRREIILSRLRGVGAVTPGLIERVAESYANGDVEVSAAAAQYTVRVTFISTIGIPDQIDALKEALRDIVPAHMAIEYVFRFYTYGELKARNLTYGQLKAQGITYHTLKNRGIA